MDKYYKELMTGPTDTVITGMNDHEDRQTCSEHEKYSLEQIKKALVKTWTTEGDLNFYLDEDGIWLIDDWQIFVDNLSETINQ